MSVSRKLLSQKGFTLVELLIVVAIIGVLSTIGVPTFRKMIQKAKKSEAKVNLGGLYTAEQAFFSEYGLYGNQVDKIGFETDGQNLIYVVGFMSTSCSHLTIKPVAGDGNLSTGMLNAFSDYSSTPNLSFTGRLTGSAAGALTACPYTASKLSPAYTENTVDVYSINGGENNAFIAMAVGVISPNVNNTTPTAGTVDVWAINDKRRLANTEDGVGKKSSAAAAPAGP